MNSGSSSGAEADLANVVESLTGINLGSLGLRSLPVLEARKGKKKNSTAIASEVAVSFLRFCIGQKFSTYEHGRFRNVAR